MYNLKYYNFGIYSILIISVSAKLPISSVEEFSPLAFSSVLLLLPFIIKLFFYSICSF